MPYEKYHGNIPVIYIDTKKQEWFESLEKINKFKIPKNYISSSKLKQFGIMVEDSEAIGWTYQAFTHEVILLFDFDKYKLCDNATNKQKSRYKEFYRERHKQLYNPNI